MDKKRSILNVTISILFKLLIVVASLVNRRYLIQCIGNEINGLNSLFTSIIGFLSVADLGVGSAITFCMYKPIIEKDDNKVAALYGLFKKLYFVISLIILGSGLLIMPFLPLFVADMSSVTVNIYLTFGIVLVSTVISYFFSSKTSLINAYKDNFITTTINSLCLIICDAVQVLVLVISRSFVLYLSVKVISVLIEWVITSVTCKRKHGDLMAINSIVDDETKKQVSKNVKAMFSHKIGGMLVNTADSVIISAFIGVAALGSFSNYTIVMSGMVGVITLFFTPLTSVLGHMCASKPVEEQERYYGFFYSFNYVIAVVFFAGYYAIIDNLVSLLFDGSLTLAKSISFIITLNQFIQFMRKSTLIFRDATGTFYYDRWKPLFEGVVNVVLSIVLVLLMPDELKIVGVIVATIITNLLICHIVEPLVLYKYAFRMKPTKHIVKNYLYIIAFCVSLFLFDAIMVDNSNDIKELLINGFMSLGVSFSLSLLVFILDKEFRNGVLKGIKKCLISRKRRF